MPADQENALGYPHGDAVPAAGCVIDIAEGVRWVRMRLPFALDHINLWLLRDHDEAGRAGWALVDCGIADDATRAAWEQVFRDGLDGMPVLRVIATHMHPDHLGLAHWLTHGWSNQRWSASAHECRLWMSATDWLAARIASQATSGFGGERAAQFFASHGLTDPDALTKVRARGNYYASMVPQVPDCYRRLMDGQRLRIGVHEWQCIAGYGHAPEHIALHCATLGLLISGDMLLPRISTNISVTDSEPEADPLPLFLRSLQALTTLPADTTVLPSHGRPFSGLHTRVAQLQAHHADRLADVLAACASAPQSAAQLLAVLFRRPLDLHQTTFAMGESIAHLHALWHAGRLRRVVAPDGAVRFSLPSAG